VSELDSDRVPDYFRRRNTVAEWWTPDEGPLAFHYDAELKVLEDALVIDPAWRVLDVGTGRGRFGAFFATRGCDVWGIDLNPEMVELARETAERRGVSERFTIEVGSATDLAVYAQAPRDLVLCMELFDHLPDLPLALRELRSATADSGRFAFTYVPSESLYGALGNVYRAVKRRFQPQELLISRTYGLAEIRSLLADAGFELEGHWGVGVLCLNAQTRLFEQNLLAQALTGLARLEARIRPYYRGRLARHGAHVVGIARPVRGA
jgi:2-polyprenyl-3-methyl-5-hydroxy-6-metoxy-1,4-benzoquinol methylase